MLAVCGTERDGSRGILRRGAGLVGAVTYTVCKVHLAAVARNVASGAAELSLGNVDHVGNASLLCVVSAWIKTSRRQVRDASDASKAIVRAILQRDERLSEVTYTALRQSAQALSSSESCARRENGDRVLHCDGRMMFNEVILSDSMMCDRMAC